MEKQRKATPRQLAYIQQLKERQGEENIEMGENLGFEEASKMIEDLIGISPRKRQVKPWKINEARLGMVLKECYRYFRHHERDILKEHRQKFRENVIKTYQLFTEIAQELEQGNGQMEA
jgi:hypothetical protein